MAYCISLHFTSQTARWGFPPPGPPQDCAAERGTAVPTLGWARSRGGSTQPPASSPSCSRRFGGVDLGGFKGAAAPPSCCRSLWPPAHNFPGVIFSGFIILQNAYTSASFFFSTCFLHRCRDSLLTHRAILLRSLPWLCPLFCTCCYLSSLTQPDAAGPLTQHCPPCSSPAPLISTQDDWDLTRLPLLEPVQSDVL